jgi:O-antigen/teichoic acid export membrane protein
MKSDSETTTPGPPAQGLVRTASANAGAAFATRISVLLSGMVLTPFLLRHLGRELYGLVVTVGSLYEYLSLLRGGMPAAMRRHVTLYHHAADRVRVQRYYNSGFWWAGALRAGILLIAVFLAVPVCHFMRVPDALVRDSAIGVVLIIVAAAVADTWNVLSIPIYATGRTSPLSAANGAIVWVRLAVIVVLFRLVFPSLAVYGSAQALTELMFLVVVFALARRTRVVDHLIPKPAAGDPEIRGKLFRYGGLAILAQAAGVLYVSTDNIFIGRIFGTAMVTRYNLGTRWAPLITGLVVGSIASLTPLFTSLEARGEAERGRSALLRVVRLTSALAVPACLVPCVVGDLFLANWVGPDFRSSAQFLIAMLVPTTFEVAMAPVWMALEAKGRIGWIATGAILVAFGNVALSLVLAFGFRLGPLGFALGNTAAILARNLIIWPFAARRDPDFPRPIRLFTPLFKALAGGAPGLVLLYLTRRFYGGGLVQVIAAGFAGGALCLAGAALAAVGPGESRSFVRSLLGGRRARNA